jgi:hypothetical protein
MVARIASGARRSQVAFSKAPTDEDLALLPLRGCPIATHDLSAILP